MKVLLVGPKLSQKDASYGGGTGGYTRNMAVYLNYFEDKKYELLPCYHTVRKKGRGITNSFLIRFFIDAYVFVSSIIRVRPSVVHILGQYRTAIPREFFYVAISSVLGIPVVYEIKAGAFDVWHGKTNFLFRWMVSFVVRKSAVILVEGKRYIDFLKSEYSITAFYFPNYVPIEEIPSATNPLFLSEYLRLCFIGYCYEGKGVFELVEGCNLAAAGGVKIKLQLVGYESQEFTEWVDTLDVDENLQISRMGRKEHQDVLKIINENDIFCLPSRHYGEGHNNSLNEAMMYGRCLLVSKAGFICDVVSVKEAYILDHVTSSEIASCIQIIHSNLDLARDKAALANEKLKKEYVSNVIYERLRSHYDAAVR
ncbi:MAG: glycosyltransferase family 4 protein [Deltaproteobacteria bacterium]|nr:glycosyltransferase family 4 protein [Deltaproteobacteria bacterium]